MIAQVGTMMKSLVQSGFIKSDPGGYECPLLLLSYFTASRKAKDHQQGDEMLVAMFHGNNFGYSISCDIALLPKVKVGASARIRNGEGVSMNKQLIVKYNRRREGKSGFKKPV